MTVKMSEKPVIMKQTSQASTKTQKAKKINKKHADKKSDQVLKTDSLKDKHSKLKDRKKFKKLKALEKKKNKISDAGIGGQSSALNKKASGKVDNKKKLVSESEKSSLSKKKREKKLQWKKKQMAQRLARINKTENEESKTKDKGKNKDGKKNKVKKTNTVVKNEKDTTVKNEKIPIAKSVDEATANWSKLQQTLSNETQSSTSRKRKIPYDRLRNPKLRKLEEGSGEENNTDSDTKEPEIWFDDVDEILLDRKPAVSMPDTSTDVNDESEETEHKNPLVKPNAFKGVTKIVCMDCEMVGVGDGTDNMLARVSIVNQYGEPIYDKFVKPKEDIVDYRTHVSGVRPSDLKDAEIFEDVQKDVANILKGRTLVGHAIKNDLKVLYISHPKRKIRDTSTYKPFKQLTGGRTPSLKKLSDKILSVKVQEGEHNSIQDAQATMRLYTMYRKQWEGEIMKKKKGKGASKTVKEKT